VAIGGEGPDDLGGGFGFSHALSVDSMAGLCLDLEWGGNTVMVRPSPWATKM
jgi:hypothetical protein